MTLGFSSEKELNMQDILRAHCATVFLLPNFKGIDKIALQKDYHQKYHAKRLETPVTTDSYHFITVEHTQENLDALVTINDLVKKPHLRAINFILLDDPTIDISDDDNAQLKYFMKEWDNMFRKSSFTGSLVMGICVQNFEALLIEGTQVRGVNRLSLGL